MRLQTAVLVNSSSNSSGQNLDLRQNATATLSQLGFDTSSHLIKRRVQTVGGHKKLLQMQITIVETRSNIGTFLASQRTPFGMSPYALP